MKIIKRKNENKHYIHTSVNGLWMESLNSHAIIVAVVSNFYYNVSYVLAHPLRCNLEMLFSNVKGKFWLPSNSF